MQTPPEQAANLRTRAELMQQIAAIIKEGWTQVEAAEFSSAAPAPAASPPTTQDWRA